MSRVWIVEFRLRGGATDEWDPCSLAAIGWESEPDIFRPWRKQYRCPKHRRNRPALATIGEMQKAKP